VDLTARPFRFFVRVAELRSFSRAAESLGVSQPALSSHLREFERVLGFALFTRTSRRVELTAQGQQFLAYARRMILESQWMSQAVTKIASSQLQVGVAHHTADIELRMRLIETFALQHPDIPFAIHPRHPRQLIEDLEQNLIDVAVALEMLNPVAGSVIEGHISCERRIVLDTRAVALAVPATRNLTRSTISTAGLANRRIATLSRAHGVAISDTIAHELSQAGAVLVRPPEGDARSILRYALTMSLPAVDLGWFKRPRPLLSRPVAWPLRTALVVLSPPAITRGVARKFLDHAQTLAKRSD
jgi:DNA-binding transcriptional LysR family regulator